MQRLLVLVSVLAIGLGACGGEGDFRRPVAEPGEIVSVVDGDTPGMPDEAKIQDFVVAPDGTLYLAVTGGSGDDSRIIRVPAAGPPVVLADEKERTFPGDPGFRPWALAFDAESETLYVADATFDDGAGRIRAIGRDGERRNVVTIAGEQAEDLDVGGFFAGEFLVVAPGSVGLYVANGCQFARVDGEEVVLVADASSVYCMVGYSPEDGGSNDRPLFGEGVKATEGAIRTGLGGMTVDPNSGDLLLAVLRGVFRVDHRGVVTKVAGGGEMAPTSLPLPASKAHLESAHEGQTYGMVVDPRTGDVYIAQPSRDSVLRLTSEGKISVFAGSGDGRPAAAPSIDDPRRVGVDARGNAYIGGVSRLWMVASGG